MNDIVVGIYKIKNIKSGRFYIGSSVNIKKRWRDHVYKLNTNQHRNIKLQIAWDRDGSKAFVFEIMETCELALLLEREQYYLDKYKPHYRGYNMSKYAKYAWRHWGITKETRRKMKIERDRGKVSINEMIKRGYFNITRNKLSKITRAKISAAMAGENNHRYGKPVSEETKKKISESMINRPDWEKRRQYQKRSETLRQRKLKARSIALKNLRKTA